MFGLWESILGLVEVNFLYIHEGVDFENLGVNSKPQEQILGQAQYSKIHLSGLTSPPKGLKLNLLQKTILSGKVKMYLKVHFYRTKSND